MSGNEADWRRYEREIRDELAAKYPTASVQHDVRLPGNRSSTERQIDILVEEEIHGSRILTVVEAKYRSRPIDVQQVESFIGLLHDIQVHRGVLVSVSGYSSAAYSRAYRDDVDLDLDVFTLDEFKQWQAAGGIPHAGDTAVVLPAPFGWVLEIGSSGQARARLFRRGLTFEAAYQSGEFMYVNIWNRDDAVHSLDLLLEHQERSILCSHPDARICVDNFADRNDHRTCLRRSEIPSYPSAELTGFVEFPRAILFTVLFSPLAVERRNLRKLEYMLKSAIPLEIIGGGRSA